MGSPQHIPSYWRRVYPTDSEGTVAKRNDGVRIVAEGVLESRPFITVGVDGVVLMRREKSGRFARRRYKSVASAIHATDRDMPPGLGGRAGDVERQAKRA